MTDWCLFLHAQGVCPDAVSKGRVDTLTVCDPRLHYKNRIQDTPTDGLHKSVSAHFLDLLPLRARPAASTARSPARTRFR